MLLLLQAIGVGVGVRIDRTPANTTVYRLV